MEDYLNLEAKRERAMRSNLKDVCKANMTTDEYVRKRTKYKRDLDERDVDKEWADLVHKAKEIEKEHLKIAKRQKLTSIPKKIIPISSSDKSFRETWTPNRDLLNFPKSYRSVLIGPPDSGKTCVIKNILLRANPPFKKIIIVQLGLTEDRHQDSEWSEVDAEIMTELPDPTGFTSKVPTALIIEDLEYKLLPDIEKFKLDRLFSYASSHCNVSIFLTGQDGFNIPPTCRRTTSLMIIYRQPDLNALSIFASRSGLTKDDFAYIFHKFIKSRHDSLWCDLTPDSPARYRINGYQVLNINPDDKKNKIQFQELTQKQPIDDYKLEK